MSAASAALPLEKSKSLRAIFWGGLKAGALDITAAFVSSGLRGVGPIRILQAIASGVLGAASYKGGFATATLGMALHFVIAFGATAVCYAASRKLTFLVQRAVLCGLIYGIHMLCVGLPISLVVRRYSK